MNGIQVQILSQLKPGKHNAIPGRVLANNLGFRDDRAVRLEIRELIRIGHPIASSVNPPYGYYMAATTEEIEEYLRVMRTRLVEDAYRRRDFKQASRKLYEPGEQLKLELVEK